MNKKDLGVIFGLFFAIAMLVIFGRGFTSIRPVTTGNQASSSAAAVKNYTPIKIGATTFSAIISDEASERKIGLSKHDSLPTDQGMLFVFDKKDKYAIWMKDMKFAIDIIWISNDKKIVEIAKNAAVETGKKDRDLTVYRPKADALYILEVNAGVSDLRSLKVGDSLEFVL